MLEQMKSLGDGAVSGAAQEAVGPQSREQLDKVRHVGFEYLSGGWWKSISRKRKQGRDA